MKYEPNDFGIETPEEEQADLVLRAYADGLHAVNRRAETCPAATELSAFAASGLDKDDSRRVLAHLSSCTACRAWERSLSRQLLQQPMIVHNLVRLRQAALQDELGVASAVRGARAWARSLAQAPVAGRGRSHPLLAAVVADGAEAEDYLEFEIVSPPRIDEHGRFRLTLSPVGSIGALALVVALQDEDRRMEICALPAESGDTTLLADCSFLELGSGPLNPDLLHLTLMPLGIVSEWNVTRILPDFRRILDCHLDPVDLWDAVSVVLAEAGKEWPKLLESEILALDSPFSAVCLADALSMGIGQFIQIWDPSNHKRHTWAEDAMNVLSELAGRTWPARRKGALQGDTVRATKKEGRDRLGTRRRSDFAGENER